MNDDVVLFRHKDVQPLKVGDEVFRSAYDWELTEKDLEKAARELGETEEKKKECLRKLKEKLSNDSSVKYRQDDAYLLRYLRGKKYDIKRAFQNLKLFTQQRRKFSSFFAIPVELKSVQVMNLFTFLPYTDEEGRIVTFLNFSKWDPHKSTFEEMVQSASMVCDLITMNPKFQTSGTVAVRNMEGITARHISELLWNGRLMSLPDIFQKGYPFRIHKWIVLNTNRLVRFLYSIARPLLQRKVAERVILLGSDMTELHQHVNPALLPNSLKGTLEEEELDMTQYILDNLPYLRYERSFVFD